MSAELKQTESSDSNFLFVHVPKLNNYYKLIDEYMYVNYLPMGVFAVCDYLNRNGVQSRIKHLGLETILNSDFSIARFVRENHIPVVGMSLHWHFQSFDVIDVAQKIKAASPETVIVLGGLTASCFADEILTEFTHIDAVIRGDGEKGALTFARAVMMQNRDFSQVENCTWRNRDGDIVDNGISFVATSEDLDSYDFANLSLLDKHDKYRDYFKMPMFWMNNASVKDNLKIRMASETMFPLAIGRGCPVNCTYCGGSASAQRKLCGRKKYSVRSVESIVETMESAMNYGYTAFLSSFDPTPRDDRYYLRLFETMRHKKVKPGYALEFWGLPTERLIENYVRTVDLNRSYIALSPDSGSEKVRRRNKGMYYGNDELYQTMDLLLKYKVPTVIYFTIGLVDESFKDIQKTIDLGDQLKKKWGRVIDGMFCFPIQIEPASPMYETPEKYGVTSTRSSFMDFYHSHRENNSGPFSYLGYTNSAYEEAAGDLKMYENAMQQVRCKHFCLLSPRLFGKIEMGLLSRMLCNLKHAKWKRDGFGFAPEERRTFR